MTEAEFLAWAKKDLSYRAPEQYLGRIAQFVDLYALDVEGYKPPEQIRAMLMKLVPEEWAVRLMKQVPKGWAAEETNRGRDQIRRVLLEDDEMGRQINDALSSSYRAIPILTESGFLTEAEGNRLGTSIYPLLASSPLDISRNPRTVVVLKQIKDVFRKIHFGGADPDFFRDALGKVNAVLDTLMGRAY